MTPPALRRLRALFAWGLLLRLAAPPAANAQVVAPTLLLSNRPGLDALKEVPFAALSSPAAGALGQAALSIRPGEWKHAETENFIYHYFHSFLATPVSVEAEFYYRVIARDLGKDTARWERKANIYIFENEADWHAFQSRANLDPWTGGVHSHNELFITRDPNRKFQGNTLGHETSHLVVDRFFGSNVPLWLNEGYAEYISAIAYASFYRSHGNYNARPHFHFLPAADYMPPRELTERAAYPAETPKVIAFYIESEVLVRFLSGEDKAKFGQFFELLSKGALFDTALRNAFSIRFNSPAAFEEEFRRYVHSTLVRKD